MDMDATHDDPDILPELQEEVEDLQGALGERLSELVEALHAEAAHIYRVDFASRFISLWLSSDPDPATVEMPVDFDSLVGYVALTRESFSMDRFDTDVLSTTHHKLQGVTAEHATGREIQSIMLFPIISQKRAVGVFEVLNCTSDEQGFMFSDEDFHGAMDFVELLSRIMLPYEGGEARRTAVLQRGPYEALVERNLVSTVALEEAKHLASLATEVSVGKLLVSSYGVPLSAVRQCLEEYYNLPYVGLESGLETDAELMDELNTSFLLRQHWVPLLPQEEGGPMLIVIDDPHDQNRVAEIERLLSEQNFELCVGLTEDILSFIIPSRDAISDSSLYDDNLDDMVESLEQKSRLEHYYERSVYDLLDERAPEAVKLVNRLIVDAIKLGASDIHIEPEASGEPSVIRMRVDGECREVLALPNRQLPMIIARVKVMANLDIAERRFPQDGKITVQLKEQRYEIRVATVPTVNGESGVLRILAISGALPLSALNLSAENSERIREAIVQPYGLFLCVGPTGSGKTTTLHSLLAEINTPERKIWTAEDPVEITQKGLQQVQVNPKIDFTFARALRSFLRADPDVILIGEIRDFETAQAGIQASLTGHMVFSTLHTNSAPETVTRLLDMGLDAVNFADALVGILAQRLVRVLCRACKVIKTPDSTEWATLRRMYGQEWFEELGVQREDSRIYEAVGCRECLGSGYKGRTGIHELLITNRELKQLIVEEGGVGALRTKAMELGMRTLRQDGVRKILSGATDIRQVRMTTGTSIA